MAEQRTLEAEQLYKSWQNEQPSRCSIPPWEQTSDAVRAEWEAIAAARRASPAMGEDSLPPLPEPYATVVDHDNAGGESVIDAWIKLHEPIYTAEQVRQAQREAVAADRRARAFSPESGAETAVTRMGAGLDRVREIPLARQSAPEGAPVGMVMVPIEPTQEMKEAAVDRAPIIIREHYARDGKYTGTATSLSSEMFGDAYKAMLHAAPTSPGTQLARQSQQPAQRASVDTPELRALFNKLMDAAEDDQAAYHRARTTLIAHIDAWGSAGSTAGAVLADPVEAGRQRLEQKWDAEGDCESCGWHAVLSEHDVEDTDIADALQNHGGLLELGCRSKDSDDRETHRGVRINIAAPSNQSPAEET